MQKQLLYWCKEFSQKWMKIVYTVFLLVEMPQHFPLDSPRDDSSTINVEKTGECYKGKMINVNIWIKVQMLYYCGYLHHFICLLLISSLVDFLVLLLLAPYAFKANDFRSCILLLRHSVSRKKKKTCKASKKTTRTIFFSHQPNKTKEKNGRKKIYLLYIVNGLCSSSMESLIHDLPSKIALCLSQP